MRRRRKNASTDSITIGTVVGVFGIKGQVKIEPTTDFGERFDKGNVLFIEGTEYKITWTAWHKGQVRVGLSGVSTPEGAAELIGRTVEIPREWRPELDADEYYAGDLMGMEVTTTEGRSIGPVTQVITGRTQDLLDVGGILIPMVKHFVRKIDIERGTITVELIEGMLPDENLNE